VEGLKDQHDTDVRDTHSLDDTLQRYGVSRGPITTKDILDTGPLGQGLTAPPNSNSPGNAPPQGPSEVIRAEAACRSGALPLAIRRSRRPSRA
jgi:hypothetical protein